MREVWLRQNSLSKASTLRPPQAPAGVLRLKPCEGEVERVFGFVRVVVPVPFQRGRILAGIPLQMQHECMGAEGIRRKRRVDWFCLYARNIMRRKVRRAFGVCVEQREHAAHRHARFPDRGDDDVGSLAPGLSRRAEAVDVCGKPLYAVVVVRRRVQHDVPAAFLVVFEHLDRHRAARIAAFRKVRVQRDHVAQLMADARLSRVLLSADKDECHFFPPKWGRASRLPRLCFVLPRRSVLRGKIALIGASFMCSQREHIKLGKQRNALRPTHGLRVPPGYSV